MGRLAQCHAHHGPRWGSRAGMRALVTATLVLVAFVVPALADEPLPLDREALFTTHVRHHRAQIHRGGRHAAAGPYPALAATCTDSAYPAPQPSGIVTPTSTFPEAEEHIAVDPNNPSNLVAAVSDFDLAGGGVNTTKYVFSTDNGATWTESYVPMDPFGLGFLMTGDGFFWLANSDPTVAIDRQGFVYMANLYLDVFDNGNGLYVSVANLTSGAVTFTADATRPVAVNPSASTTIFEDKPWLAVDNGNNSRTAGTVYATWSRFVGDRDSIVLSRSLNRGQTWSRPIRISPRRQDGAVQGSQVAVGPNGEVYVAYEVFYTGGRRQHFLAKSTNRGVTFSAPRPITPVFNEVAFGSTYRVNSFLSLAVDQSRRGTVYGVYADQPSGAVGAEVEFITSSNGGATFSSPVVINDASQGQQFMPAITVDSSGVVHAMWFDTRNSPGDPSRYDIYATFSKFPGTFAANTRVTPPLPDNPNGASIDAGTATFIGDYAGVAASGGFAHPVWTSGGFNNGILQTTTLPLP